MFSSVPVEEQEEFKQLKDDIQELQHLLNQDFRQKTVSARLLTCAVRLLTCAVLVHPTGKIMASVAEETMCCVHSGRRECLSTFLGLVLP